MSLAQDLVRELFYYEDGKLFNKVKRGKRIMVGEEAGSLYSTGYQTTMINRKRYSNHRLIHIYHYGKIANDLQVDHIDRNRLNNNIENLRLVTIQENQFNTNAKGYYFCKSINKFRSQIVLKGKQKYLGDFDTAEEARGAYLKAKNELHIIKERSINELGFMRQH